MSTAITELGTLLAVLTNAKLGDTAEYRSQLTGFGGERVAAPVTLFTTPRDFDNRFSIAASGDHAAALQVEHFNTGCNFLPLTAAGLPADAVLSIPGTTGSCEDLRADPGGYTYLEGNYLQFSTVRLDPMGAVLERNPIDWDHTEHVYTGPWREPEPDGSIDFVWEDYGASGVCLVFQKIAADGTAATSRLELGCHTDSAAIRIVALTRTRDGLVAAWEETPPDEGGTVMVVAFDAAGHVTNPPRAIEYQRGRGISLNGSWESIADAHDDVLVAWFERERPGPNDTDLVLAVLSPSAILRAPPRVLRRFAAAEFPMFSAPRIAATPTGAVIFYSAGKSQEQELYSIGLTCVP